MDIILNIKSKQRWYPLYTHTIAGEFPVLNVQLAVQQAVSENRILRIILYLTAISLGSVNLNVEPSPLCEVNQILPPRSST